MSDSARLLEEARDRVKKRRLKLEDYGAGREQAYIMALEEAWAAATVENERLWDQAAELQRLSSAQRQLDAVDAALPEWEPEPESEVGCVGRVQTILNLNADRAELRRLREALERWAEECEDANEVYTNISSGYVARKLRAALAGSTAAREEET